MEKIDKYDIAVAEVCNFLHNIPKQKYDLLPKKLIDLFEKYKDYNIGGKIDLEKSYEEQEISQMAKDMIFIITYNYWLTEEQKCSVLKQMEINEEKLYEKYNSDNLFKNKKTYQEESIEINSTQTSTQMIKTDNQNFIQKIINFFKNIFKKNS